MRACGIPTADWIEPKDAVRLQPDGKKYIIKSCWEHASIGIDDDSIFIFDSAETISAAFARKIKELGPLIFAERFISGREFNISVLTDENGAMRVLKPAEMTWNGTTAGDNVMNYKAKWVEDTEEYDITRRTFDFTASDAPLLEKITAISQRCAEVFSLNGYARVDYRVEGDQPYVLEVNANPCLSPESGIASAARHVGISYDELIKLIVDNRIRK
jgi:D-alanine-D-alanine ligase